MTRPLTAAAIPEITTPMPLPAPDLPIAEALPALLQALERGCNVVLQAPPGAGKTTGVPLALIEAAWLGRAKIVMLEPRRLAAKAAARRMAALLGEAVGARVGYRIRLESRVGPETRIEIVTDGIFTRMIQDDPALSGIGAILVDECHERRLDSDLGLALALEAQAALRPELRLIAMSATLDAEPLAALMAAEIVSSAGRAYPVAIEWLAQPAADRLVPAVVDAIRQALAAEPGGVLVFLPGGGEIRRVERALAQTHMPGGVDIFPLYGELDGPAQDRALAPAALGRRKLVLATSIAETSLTIPGIAQVVDAGLARASRFDPRTGMTRLDTQRVSQQAAEQRAGRAGRTQPGRCWRLWPEAAHKGLPARAEPEIATGDLAPLALELASWGSGDPAALRLLDPPAPAGFAAARRLLQALGALDDALQITPHGRRMAALGLPPRLAHMVLSSAGSAEGATAAALAAALSERDGATRDADLRVRLERIEAAGDRTSGDEAARRARMLARRIGRQAGIAWAPLAPARAGALLALAYPDRIGQRRAEPGRFRLSGGQGAYLPEGDPLAGSPFLAIADLDGQMPESRIWLAAPLTAEELELALPDRITVEDETWFDPATRAVQARRRRKLGALVLSKQPLAPPSARIEAALIGFIRKSGLGVLPWTPAATALRERIAFLAQLDGAEAWPAQDDSTLLAELETWLGPALAGRRSLAELAGLDLAALLRARLDFAQGQTLDRRAPTHLIVPSGSRIAIDYGRDGAPVLAVKLQELFGLAETPRIAEGKVALVLELLSPAQRPIQVTSDLGGFWAGSYKSVRADLRGRYPRHPWPEDPLAAQPTARAKPRRP
jgi:ATP-dependent helicase HrpB